MHTANLLKTWGQLNDEKSSSMWYKVLSDKEAHFLFFNFIQNRLGGGLLLFCFRTKN